MKTILHVMLAAGAAVSVFAQAPDKLLENLKDQVIKLRLAQQGTFEFVTGGLISGQPIKGAPFSAEAVTETTQTLADGNRIVQKSSSKQYRDSEGRERKEETSAMGAIFITDPVARVNYTLHPETRTAERGSLGLNWPTGSAPTFFFTQFGTQVAPAPPAPPPPPPPPAGAIQGRGGRGSISVAGAGGDILILPNELATPGFKGVKAEELGTVQIEGVVAQGTRTTTTIPAGQIGNQRDINVVYERWYSPDLQLTVMTKLSDPRSGETLYKLTNIVRIEQPSSLFEIPTDYAVTVNTPGIRLRVNPQQ